MIPGGPLPPGNRDSLWGLARYVAAKGAIVFTADYRSSPTYGGGFPATFADIACAIRFARASAPALRGDPRRVTLVAHSYGGFPAAVLALSNRDYAANDDGCMASDKDGRPDAFVGVAALYTLNHIDEPFLATFFGGSRAAAPNAWAAGDVASLLAAKAHPTPPMRLVAGSADRVAPPTKAEDFADLSRAHGFTLDVVIVSDANHDSILQKLATVDAILEVAGKP